MKKFILFSLFFSFVTLSMLIIQACNNPTNTETSSAEASDDTVETMDNGAMDGESEFMAAAANGGMMEVEAGRLAQQNGASAAVKEFGAKMVADHSKANGELQALAASKNIVLPASPNEEVQKHLAEMSAMKGADFDRHYMDMMVSDHDKTVSMFEETSRDGKDADVRAWASKTLPVLKEHQEAAKSVKAKL